MNLLRAFCLVLVTLLSAQAHAHALLDRAEPRVGATVRTAPKQLKLWFTLDIDPSLSTAMVMDAKGGRVDKNDAQVDLADRALIRVSLDALAPGDYTVVWRAGSSDGHLSQGDFVFHVGP
jgi:hypothetical protein